MYYVVISLSELPVIAIIMIFLFLVYYIAIIIAVLMGKFQPRNFNLLFLMVILENLIHENFMMVLHPPRFVATSKFFQCTVVS